MVDPIISVVKESTDLDITEIRSPNDFSEDFISIQFQQRKTMFKINSSQLESLQHQFVNDVQLIVEDSVHEMERELELATESVVWQLHILDSEIVDLNKAKEHLRDFKNSINSFTSGLIARISSVNGEGSRGELFLSNDSRAASNDEVKEMEKINNNNQSTSVQFNELHRIVSDCLTALSPYRSNHPSFQLPLVLMLFNNHK